MTVKAVRVAAVVVLALVMLGAISPALASAAPFTASLTLQQGGSQAGSTVSFGTDIKFNSSSPSTSPETMTLVLPPGQLSNAAIDGGNCLKSATAISACQVGIGTVNVTAYPTPLTPVPLSLGIKLYLVAPPKSGDLAGLLIQLSLNGSQLGPPGEVKVKPGPASTADPSGAGGTHVEIDFAGIPNNFPLPRFPLGVPLAVNELQTTLSGTRLPTNCTAPATVQMLVTSYTPGQSAGDAKSLSVTGCSSLAFTPAFAITAVKDAADSGVQVTTDITQPVTPTQATSRNVVLTLPGSVLAPNVTAVLTGGILCADPTSGTCKTIGTATSVSPLYPVPLVGKAYLTGALTAPAIELVFPPPFALTLAGNVDLATNSTTFAAVPDLPLTDLKVTLTGGPNSVFMATCNPSSGTASSTLTTQNGDRTLTVSKGFSVSGCTASGGGTPFPPSGGGSGGGSGPPAPGGQGGGTPAGRPRLSAGSVSGLAHGRDALRFRLTKGSHAPKLSSFTVSLPRGLSFRRAHHRLLSRLHVSGARVRSVKLVHWRLVVTLVHAVSGLGVRITGLGETSHVERLFKHHRLHSLRLRVLVTDAAHRRTSLSTLIRSLHG